MEIKYLGTAAAEGWPALFCSCPSCMTARKLGGKNIRTRAQAVIDEKLLIDFGPDTYLHTIRDGLRLYEINHCLITHGHCDHFYPTDLVMKGSPYALNGKKEPFHIYGTKRIFELYSRMRDIDDDSPDLDACVKFQEIHVFETFCVQNYKITPLRAVHNPEECCLIYLIEDDKGKTILYGHDTAFFPEDTWEFLEGKKIDLVSLDCTMGVLEDGATHMGYQGNIRTRERLINIGCTHANTIFVLNHFSHNCGKGISHEEMEILGQKNGFLTAYDGFKIEI